MADPSAYAPLTPKVAKLDPKEKHLHSFVIAPYVYEKRGGFLLKIAMWYPDNTRFYLHLTDQRMLLEPYDMGVVESLFLKGLIHLAGALVDNPGMEAGTTLAEGGLEKGAKRMAKFHGKVASLPYTDLAKVESFRQGLGTLVRMEMKGHPNQPIVVQVSGAHQGLMNFGCSSEFVQVVSALLGKAR